MSEGETGCSEAIMTAAKEAKKENMGLREGLRKIGAAISSSREVSAQEFVYRCLPELWLRKTYPAIIFVNADLPERRIRTRKTEKVLAELDPESTDIYNSNVIDRYSDRPDCDFQNGIYATVDRLCLAEFAAYYYKVCQKCR